MARQTIAIKASSRNEMGSKKVVKVRDRGRLPAVIYGHRKDPRTVDFDYHDFYEAIHHGHRLFDVDKDGQNETLLVKDLQYDHLGRRIIHADMVRVDLSEVVHVTVPVVLKGTPKGYSQGGIVDQHLDHIVVECTVAAIPEEIDVSIKELELDQSIHARDVKLPQGVKLLSDAELLIASCHIPKKHIEEVPLEAVPMEPEVITARKPEEEQAEETKEE